MLKIIKFIKSLFVSVKSCFYVGASDILPEPLSEKDEEKYIIYRLVLGDDGVLLASPESGACGGRSDPDR